MAVHENSQARHVVAIVGGATAGSEVARILAERGALALIIEQNPRPYGKIEDGLPRWHVKQRRDEYEEINKRIDRPGVEYLPQTRLGRDLDYEELVGDWGLSAVVLAHGAWRDRPFPVQGADEYVDRGLVYQNPLIYWFNHYPEATYDGPRYELMPGTVVVGGGLASIDVVKVLQLEMALKALAERGFHEDMVKMEREGIEPVLAAHGLKWAELGIKPCKLYYRRRVLDMPLSDIPPDAPQKRADALRAARAKILDKAQRKFLFEFQELRAPNGLVVEGDRLVGVRFAVTEMADGQLRTVPDKFDEGHGSMTISSIGSIPEPLPGIQQKGEIYTYVDQKIGLLRDGPTAVFAAGNVLTGKGNIKDSLDNGTEVGLRVAESYLGLTEERLPLKEGERAHAAEHAENIAGALKSRPPLSPDTIERVLQRFRERQRAMGYDGDYRGWLARKTPPDLQ